MGKVVLLVIVEGMSNSLADELAVLLQSVECVLDCLVDGFLYGVTQLLDLIDTLTWLLKDKTCTCTDIL